MSSFRAIMPLCKRGKLVPHNFRAAPDLQLATLYNDTNV